MISGGGQGLSCLASSNVRSLSEGSVSHISMVSTYDLTTHILGMSILATNQTLMCNILSIISLLLGHLLCGYNSYLKKVDI